MFFSLQNKLNMVIASSLIGMLLMGGCSSSDGGGADSNDTFIDDTNNTQVNHAPTATAQSLTLDEDTPKNFVLSGTDADGNTLTYTIKTSPSHGSISGNTYIPAQNYYGADSFTFVANDGNVDSAEATVSITVNPVNDAPVLSKNNLTVSFDEHNVSRISEPIKAESVDMDGDGDIDIISATWIDDQNGTLRWYENDGSQNFVEHNISTDHNTDDEYGTWSIKSIDFDDDGDIDIITSYWGEEAYETNTSIRWYENDGNQNFTEHNVTESSTRGVASIKPVDIDGDGDLDILPSSTSWWGGDSENHFVWYENVGSQNFTEHNISTGENYIFSYSAESIDLDKDGDMDILTTVFYDEEEESGHVLWYENDGSQNFTEHNIFQLGDVMSNEIDIKAVDIDNDGDIDVIGGHNWYENDGNQGFTTHNITSAFTTYFTLSDIDGDGDIDIALPYWDNSLVVWQENLGLTTLYVKEYNTTVGTMTASDVDGDSLTYSISGVDADKFTINATTGELTLKVAPDNEDNVYELNIAVTDGRESDDLNIRVIVEDIDEHDGV